MGNITDITSLLNTEKPKIKIFDKVYIIENNWVNVVAVTELQEKMGNTPSDKAGLKFMQDVLVLFLGADSAKEISSLSLDIKGYRYVIQAILGIATGNGFNVETAGKEETVTP